MADFTRLSSKGQVVIPLRIREELHLEDGTPFSIIVNDNSVCLRKIEVPKEKSWDEVVKPFRDAAKKSGFAKEDLDILIHQSRKKR